MESCNGNFRYLGESAPSETGKEPLCKSVDGICGGIGHDLSSAGSHVEAQTVFDCGEIRGGYSFTEPVSACSVFVRTGKSILGAVTPHFSQPLPESLGEQSSVSLAVMRQSETRMTTWNSQNVAAEDGLLILLSFVHVLAGISLSVCLFVYPLL